MDNRSGSTSYNFQIATGSKWVERLEQVITWGMVIIGFGVVAIATSWSSNIALVAGIALIVGGYLLKQKFQERHQRATAEILKQVDLFPGAGATAVSVPPNIPVSSLVNDYILSSAERVCPVIDHGRLVGFVQLSRVRDLPLEQWDLTEVGEIMTSANEFVEAKSMA